MLDILLILGVLFVIAGCLWKLLPFILSFILGLFLIGCLFAVAFLYEMWTTGTKLEGHGFVLLIFMLMFVSIVLIV